jgi:hypothetical protein
MAKKPTHGGARPGAGRPRKPPTTTLSYRVPLKCAAKADEAIRMALDGLVHGCTELTITIVPKGGMIGGVTKTFKL